MGEEMNKKRRTRMKREKQMENRKGNKREEKKEIMRKEYSHYYESRVHLELNTIPLVILN